MIGVLVRPVIAVVIALAGGCDYLFQLEHLNLDARVTSRPIPHLPVEGHRIGTGTLVLGDVTIDTSVGAIDPEQPFELAIYPQDGGPPIIAIYAERIEVTGQVRVLGVRALVLVAGDIHVGSGARLDGSANGSLPGPAASTTDGQGGAGRKGNGDNDSGGGGGGHGGDAAPGGSVAGGCADIAVSGGVAGANIGGVELAVLAGGGAGGPGGRGACATATAGGAGGGALQLSAFSTITVDGVIDAGGGGGAGGQPCSGNTAAGGGGGAGGALYLDAPTMIINGALAANGGGGGGAGSVSGPGLPGNDGTSTLAPAKGGVSGSVLTGDGGAGAARDLPAQPGEDVPCDSNGGGGGGATGRIVLRGSAAITGITTPLHVTL